MYKGASKDEFIERLRRIEAERERTGRSRSRKRLPDLSTLPEEPEDRTKTRGGLGAGAVMFTLMLFVALVGGAAAYVFRDEIPFDVATLDKIRRDTTEVVRSKLSALPPIPGLTGSLTGKARGSGQPLEETEDGRILRTPLVATADFTPVDVSQIVSGFQPVTAENHPAAVHEIHPTPGCRPRPLGEGEALANLRLHAGLGEVGLQAISNADLAERLIRNIEAVNTPGRAHDLGERLSPKMQVADVYLTDTSAPQYVVLQNMQDAILWNLQTAPGVEIAHVLMISPGGSAVAAAPGHFRVEAIRIGEHLSKADMDAIRRNDWDAVAARDCFVAPYRQPQPHWLISELAKEPGSGYAANLRQLETGREMFDDWFTRSFGQSASTNAVEALRAAHLLAGPLPEAPFAQVPLERHQAWMLPADNIILGTSAEREAAIEALHVDTLTRAAGGDLSRIDPAPRKVESQ